MESTAVSRCLVFCRLRPSTPKDFEDGAFQLVSVHGKTVTVKDERAYEIDGTFGADSEQEDVFQVIAVPCVSHAFHGFCSALMCYGQTGTGKSFTMCNVKEGAEGIIPRSARMIYSTISADPAREYHVSGQFVQIYRDQLGDLMSTGGRDKVDIHFDKETGVSLTGCSSHELATREDFMRFYNEGNIRRVVTKTEMNPESSRGHTAMVIRIASTAVNDPSSPTLVGKITFIDLAGYERFSKTGISNSNPVMKDEAKTINASLLALGHVVSALSRGDKHIPWRDSKLTRILQDSIGGRSRTSIILTVGPSSDHLHETTNSLQFGLRAMAVKVEAKAHITVDFEKLAAKLQMMLDERDARITTLEMQMAAGKAERAHLMERQQRDTEEMLAEHHKRLQRMREEGATEDKIARAEEIFDIERENLKEQHMEELSIHEEHHSKAVLTIAEAQRRNEAKKQTDIRLSQERIIEEFKHKLAEARDGTDGDLARALGQLAEKDVILASRANEAARLHSLTQQLLKQMEDSGITPSFNLDIPESFFDITQVEEMRSRLSGECAEYRAQVVELRTRLEELQENALTRGRELTELRDEKRKLEAELGRAAEADVSSEMVDIEELHMIKSIMQADIDSLNTKVASLQEELRLKSTQPPSEQLAPLPLGRLRGLSRTESRLRTVTPRPLTLGSARVANNPTGADAEAPQELAAMARKWKEKLADAERTIVQLRRERANPHTNGASCDSTTVDVLGESTTSSVDVTDAIDAVLKSKDDDLDGLLTALRHVEEELNAEATLKVHAEERVSALTVQLLVAGLTPATAPVVVPWMPKSSMLAALRRVVNGSRELCTAVMEGATPCIDEQLRQRDEELVKCHETIAQRSAALGHALRAVSALTTQLEALGSAPQVRLPQEDAELLKELDAVDRSRNNEVNDLEEELALQREEKERVKRMLTSMNEERTCEAQAMQSKADLLAVRLAATEEQLIEAQRALEDSRAAVVEVEEARQQLLQKSESLGKTLLRREEELKQTTRQLMDIQARHADHNEEGLLTSIKRRISQR